MNAIEYSQEDRAAYRPCPICGMWHSTRRSGVDQRTIILQDRLKAQQKEIAAKDTTVAELVEALKGLVEAVTAEVNEKGGGGYVLARLSDARAALLHTTSKKDGQ